MARAGGESPGRTLTTVAMVNYALLAFMVMQFAPPAATAALAMVLSLAGLIGWQGALHLWRRPTRRGLAAWTLAGVVAVIAVTLATAELKGLPRGQHAARLDAGHRGHRGTAAVAWSGGSSPSTARTSIEGRLRELAEQQHALDMARQLATAQIQPHFLFNTLASLQHWVQTKDDRAAPLLAALTGYLRATLPLFNRELAGARATRPTRCASTWQVMQLRLGRPAALVGRASTPARRARPRCRRACC